MRPSLTSKMQKGLPELLCPAGSRAAFEAAVEGGADAVYFGGPLFNARMNAQNFSFEEMGQAVDLAHAYSVKCYMTLNTLLSDRELPEAVSFAERAADMGVDALIVADLGAAAAIHRHLPSLALHASTQASGHNISAAAELRKLGFSRMVMAREASLADIRAFCEGSDTELEVFAHGALCVCHSGQCLFSSLVGGRSGNRGECAQPCRLPFTVNGKEKYPLSLKDLSLAPHIPALLGAGVASLKIEGRMKSPEYVRAVASVYRRLLDERRAATPDEMLYLREVFSRGGFTDGYFTSRVGPNMLGVRSEGDKETTRRLDKFVGITRKLPVNMKARFAVGEPSSLTLSGQGREVTVTGQNPEVALNRPLTEEDIGKNLTKLGGTPYTVENIRVDISGELMLPLSAVNALRRAAVEAFSAKEPTRVAKTGEKAPLAVGKKLKKTSARFAYPSQITPAAREYFDHIYLPLELYGGECDGVIMPPVIFDSERERVEGLLDRAVELGARRILVGNLGHLSLCEGRELTVVGDFRLNVFNSASAAVVEGLGISEFIASPELTLPQLRDLRGSASVIVYGRMPLMLLEKCVIRELGGCRDAASLRGGERSVNCTATLCDRVGAKFPVLREGAHRNVVYNSLPTSMSDRADQLAKHGITDRHFIFSDESAARVDAVVAAFRSGAPLTGTPKVRRI